MSETQRWYVRRSELQEAQDTARDDGYGYVVVFASEHQAVVAELATLQHAYAQLKEAYEATSAGKPLGPVIGAQTIVNQQLEIERLKAELARGDGTSPRGGRGHE